MYLLKYFNYERDATLEVISAVLWRLKSSVSRSSSGEFTLLLDCELAVTKILQKVCYSLPVAKDKLPEDLNY